MLSQRCEFHVVSMRLRVLHEIGPFYARTTRSTTTRPLCRYRPTANRSRDQVHQVAMTWQRA